MDDQNSSRDPEQGRAKVQDFVVDQRSPGPEQTRAKVQDYAGEQRRGSDAQPAPEQERTRVRAFEGREPSGRATQIAVETVASTGRAGNTAVGSAAQVFLAWQHEMYGFFGIRFDKDVRFLKQAANFSELPNLPLLQAGYLREAIADFTFGVQHALVRVMQTASQGGERLAQDAQTAAARLGDNVDQHARRN